MTSAEETLGLARLYSDGRNYQKAADLIGAALQHNPDNPTLLAEMARIQLGLENPSAAATAAYAALSLSPQDAYSMRLYAIALDRLGRPEALDLAYRAVSADPHNYLAHYVYAMLLHNADFSEDALTVITEAQRLQSADADVLFLRGRILERLGRVKESTAAYEEVLRLDPEYAAAVHNIALNRLNRGHVGRALRGFVGAARLDPQIGDKVRRNIGIALLRPLRWATVLAALVCFFAIAAIGEQDPEGGATVPLPVPRVIAGAGAVLLVALLWWVARLVPRSARKSVVTGEPMILVRAGLAACATVAGLLVAAGVAASPLLSAAMYILALQLLFIFIGWLSGK